MKKIAALLAAAALGLSLTACGSEQKPENGLVPVSLVLDWTPNTNHTGFYVAQKLGYYQEAGLEVEILLPPEGSAPAFVAAGGADFGINAQDTLAPALAGENALPITAVAALIQHNTSGLISLKEAGITSPRHLEGKVYATWDNPVEQAIVRSIMEADGGDFSKLTMLPSTVADVITALNTDMDAVWIFYAWDGVATQVKGCDTNYLDLAQLDPVFDYYTPVLIANNRFLAEQPDTAKAFLAATARGYAYASEHPEEAAEMLLEVSPELDRDIVLASQQWLADKYTADAEQWGTIDPARWDAFYTWLSENRLVEGELPAGTGYSNDYLG